MTKTLNRLLGTFGLVRIKELNKYKKVIVSNYGLKVVIDLDEYRKYCKKSKTVYQFDD